ncbi:hypothetical protein BOX15_Mlig023301g1 [Macrostomum lignano]|uniref:Uncharacterized protein n=1 Tax=Macrostomum lignano TaxID=282301 RepID=A0A267GDJ7_9PLAT|nr:hypothetical protein BOX15_Mlig023301g1 [Macrostomum lignano]
MKKQQQSNGLCDVSDEDSGDARSNGMSDIAVGRLLNATNGVGGGGDGGGGSSGGSDSEGSGRHNHSSAGSSKPESTEFPGSMFRQEFTVGGNCFFGGAVADGSPAGIDFASEDSAKGEGFLQHLSACNNYHRQWGFGTGGYNGVGTSYLPF